MASLAQQQGMHSVGLRKHKTRTTTFKLVALELGFVSLFLCVVSHTAHRVHAFLFSFCEVLESSD